MKTFKDEIRKHAHKGFTGMQMFCPVCDGVLDHKKSTAIDVTDSKTNKLVVSKIVCNTCWNSTIKHNTEKLAKQYPEYYVEVYHGGSGIFRTYNEPEIDNSKEQLNLSGV